MRDVEYGKKLNKFLDKAASNAGSAEKKYSARMLFNEIRQRHGAEAAVQCTSVMVQYIRNAASYTCLTAQEVAQIAVPEVHKLLMRGILPKHAVTVGIQNAGKRIYEAHCEKMAKHFFG